MSILSKSKLFNPIRANSKVLQYVEPVVFIIAFFAFFGYLSNKMGLQNMMNTLMQTAYHLLIETVFFIMGITVLMGALSKLLAEFGVVDLIERILRPFMKPLFNLPGVAALGAVLTFLSDNPAIITLSKNITFARHFKVYQLISLTNFGTAWGMGLVVVIFMLSQGFASAAAIGVFGAACGCLISTRLMQRFTLNVHPEYDRDVTVVEGAEPETAKDDNMGFSSNEDPESGAMARITAPTEENGMFIRILNACLDGGKSGVELGLAIIPGVLVISTLVMTITFNTETFTGAAYEGVGLLPYLADKISWLFDWLFGFTNTELLAFPITAIGAVGAAIGMVPSMVAKGIIDGNAIAVFTAIGMCWSGFLSTHAAMLDSMGYRKMISKAILSHTIAGVCAGVIAHWAYVAISMI